MRLLHCAVLLPVIPGRPSRSSVGRSFSVNTTMAATRRSARLSSKANKDADASQEAILPPPPPQLKKRKRKEASDPELPEPKTPTKKRPQPNGSLPPATPTPSAARLIAEGSDTKAKQATGRTVTRLADPRFTNATLLSPETSRVIASRDVEPGMSPSKRPASTTTTTTTTQTLLREACDHLIRVDERMRPLVEKHHCHLFSPEGLAEKIDPFESLASGIISQQVSGAAAKSIKAKFVALFDDVEDKHATATAAEAETARFPHPSEVAACSIERLRTAGLSQRKAEYIHGLAGKFVSEELTAQVLRDAPYEEVLEKLIAVRGLGKWSVEMFACFGLKRMDVFSLGDLGVQRGMAAFIGRDVSKLKSKGGKWKYMSEQDMVELSDRFAPYRSLFMWYMWRVEATDVSTME